MKSCAIEGCLNKYHAKGYCQTHYQRWSRYGTTELRPVITGCKVDGCYRKHRAKGYCDTHGRWWRDNGRVDDPNWARCRSKTCRLPQVRGGYCKTHFFESEHEKWGEREMVGKRNGEVCKAIYNHSEEMRGDPEALTDEFLEDMLGIKCRRLEREKEENGDN